MINTSISTIISLNVFAKPNEFNYLFANRLLVQSIAMTGSDLNSSSKPWEIQVKTTKVVYEEFYEQVIIILIASTRFLKHSIIHCLL